MQSNLLILFDMLLSCLQHIPLRIATFIKFIYRSSVKSLKFLKSKFVSYRWWGIWKTLLLALFRICVNLSHKSTNFLMRKRTAFQLTKIRSDTNIKITQHTHPLLHIASLFNLRPLLIRLFFRIMVKSWIWVLLDTNLLFQFRCTYDQSIFKIMMI